MNTRADLLRFSIAYHLWNVRAGRNRLGLSEETRYRIADQVVGDLVKMNSWPELTQEVNAAPTPANHPGDLRAKRQA